MSERVVLSPPPFAVLELENITPLLRKPLSGTSRIKYTCFDVSQNFIALGATSGGIYMFSRTPVEFIQLIPNKEGVITRISISSDEKYISIANGKGVVSVVECRPASSQPLNLISREHQGNEVTVMLWSCRPALLYIGDDVGKVSILQIPTFIKKTMFHSASQVIMSLDSRICQIDLIHQMLLVSTLTRCYISDTEREQYRQIGQKMRDGEFGACFLRCTDHEDNELVINNEDREKFNTYKSINLDEDICLNEKLLNIKIYCARPSSRLWEASMQGIVKRTHQFKNVLGNSASKIVTKASYENEDLLSTDIMLNEGQSVNFAKLHALSNCEVFTYKKDGIYFLNTENVEHTMWFDAYEDIIDCKVYNNKIYLWRSDAVITCLQFLKIDKYLIKTYVDEKYKLCAELINVYKNYLVKTENLSKQLHILSGLKEKLINSDLLEHIFPVLENFTLKKDDRKSTSGIFTVENNHHVQMYLEKSSKDEGVDGKRIPPEAVQVLKDLSNTVTDKFTSSKKKLKEKWENLEETMKNISIDKNEHVIDKQHYFNVHQNLSIDNGITELKRNEMNEDILHNSNNKFREEIVDNGTEVDFNKELFKSYKLISTSADSDIKSILESKCFDMKELPDILNNFEEHCKSLDISEEECSLMSSNIFLNYINMHNEKANLINTIIEDPKLYGIFVDSCVMVNLKYNKIAQNSCECGYPLPYTNSNKSPIYSELIDEFIEKQWINQTQSKCYEMCKKMPYLWRKILLLRRNEDLINILLILLQILDESLLYSFLPQFTINTWDRTIQLYSILSTNVCLNCRKKFENVNVKEILSWDDLGLLLIKSVGGAEAIEVMKKHSDLLNMGDLTFKFFHTCLLVATYEKYDSSLRNQLADTLYAAYVYEDARVQIKKLLHRLFSTGISNTSLPLAIASKSTHWNPQKHQVSSVVQNDTQEVTSINETDSQDRHKSESAETVSLESDCSLCGIHLENEVLMSEGLDVFKCGHLFHSACLDMIKVKLCPSCV